MAKLITKAEWSGKKKASGTDELLRDQWHIGDHLEEYVKLDVKAFDKRLEKLADIRRKFGEYRKALVEKDKKKAFADFVTDLDKIVRGVDKTIDEVLTAQGVAAGSTDSMKQECAAHLEIRKKALVIVTEVAKAMRGFADEAATGAAIAAKGLKQAVKAKAERSNVMVTGGIDIAQRGFDAASAALEKARALEKEKITNPSGKVIASRGDGPIVVHAAKLEKDYVAAYKLESGKCFADATKITVAINGLLQDMGNSFASAREALEEAQSLSLGAADPKKLLSTLQEIREETAKLAQILELANQKMDGDERRVATTLNGTASAPDKVRALKLVVDKQLTPRLELIAGRADGVKSLVKRAALVPSDVEDKAVAKLRGEVVGETQKLDQLYTTTKANGERTRKLYTEAISELEG